MTVDCIFYFERADVFTARNNDVLAAIFDFDIAIGFHHGQVTGVKPATCKCFLSGLWVFQIALHDNVALEHDLAHGHTIGRALCHGFRVHDSHAFLKHIPHTLPAIQTGLLRQAFVSPRVAFDSDAGGSINFREPIYMRDVETNFGHAFNHGCRWRCTCHHAPHLLVNASPHAFGGVVDQAVNDGGSAVVIDAVFAHGI